MCGRRSCWAIGPKRIGMCEEHLEMLERYVPKDAVVERVMGHVIAPSGKTRRVEEVVPRRKPSVFEKIAEYELGFAEENGLLPEE